jgi:transcriptional regulator with XRE-family HTH domain
MHDMKIKPTALIDVRQLSGLSQAELARKAGTSRSYLCRLEQGQVDGTVSVLRDIATALKVNVETITDEDGEFRPSRAARSNLKPKAVAA